MSRAKKILVGTALTLFLVWVLGIAINFIFLDFFVDVYWHHSLGYLRYLLLKTGYKYLIFAGVTGLFFGVIFLNFWAASRYLGTTLGHGEGRKSSHSQRLIRAFRSGSLKVYTPLAVLLAVPLALPLYREWERALLFFTAPAMGVRDTLYNLDIRYYMFSLPVFNLLQGRLVLTLALLFVSLAALYAAEMKILERQGRILYTGAKVHLSVVVFLIFLVQGWGYVLEAHMLQYSTNNEPIFFGPGYAELRVNLPLIWASGVFVLLTAGMLILYVNKKRGGVPLVGFAVLALLSHGARKWDALPDAVNRFIVKPNELTRQHVHMQSSIHATLAAYGLENVERREYAQLRMDDTIPELGVRTDLENIPLWDYELLGDVFQEVQGIRPYYHFSGPAAARYTVGEELHQVYLAGREINADNLPEAAQSWINRHLKYTHGYGPVMIPAAQRGEERMRWYIRDMPPASDVGLETERPEIYYGTGEYYFVIAPNRSREFNYPGLEEEVLRDYSGTGGVPVSSMFKKALFAAYFQDRNIFFTTQTQSESRILFRRNIQERIEALTPFLRLDREPYLAVTSDRLYWIQDSYTLSNWYPNSETFEEEEFNYIRNSIKVVVDAYNGTVDYYLWEPDDPIARAYQRAYPGLIKDKEEMPAELRRQVRYPRDLFEIQMHKYQVYHQVNPETFYKNEDRMEFAEIHHRETLIQMEPYYLTLDLIDFKKPEFFLMTPMLPVNRDNLRALALVGCDEENYGRIIMYTFPKGSQIYGPSQINALIDQDTEISERITLWGQQGTEVRRGKMIVFPMGRHILYIQPLYLEASGRLRIPQLKRVIVSADELVVMEANLEEAIDRLEAMLALEETLPGVYHPLAPMPGMLGEEPE